LVVSCFDQQRLVSGESETSGQWTASSAGSHDDVFIPGQMDRGGQASGQQAQQLEFAIHRFVK
jgi:hypothetical protein